MSARILTGAAREFVFYSPYVSLGDLFTEVATALSRINRFNGHTVAAYTVAQHSVLCAQAAEDETGDLELAAFCLLHDAHEAYVGDMTRPMQAAIAEELTDAMGPVAAQQFIAAVHRIKSRADTVIAEAAGLDLEGWRRHRAAIATIDLRALHTERDQLMSVGPDLMEGRISPTLRLPVRGGRIVPLPEEAARALFVETLQRLCPATAAANPTRWTA